MILRYSAIIILVVLFVTSSDPHFGTDLSWEKVPEQSEDEVRELPWMSPDSFKHYLHDRENLVSKEFTVTDYYYPTVNFWFMIYTQFESSSVVIHDRNNLSLIYKVLDFSSLHKKGLSRNVLHVLQKKLSDERIDKVKSDLKFLSKNPFSLEPQAKTIYQTLKKAGVVLPIGESDRRKFFKTLSTSIRTQTGQKNFIEAGIIRSLPYKTFLNKYFLSRKLPAELLAVPFLESSFNPKAESRVGAMGAWQFMPLIASYFVPKKSTSPKFDYRSNVGVISIAAASLMSENFRIMKSWDMAVTAYNSGTKHLLKTKRELASSNNDIDLEAVIKHSDSEHFGFASKNFYSEFLALVHALAYEEEIFSNIHREDRFNMTNNLDFYLAKCTVKLDKHLSEDQLDDILYHNHNINQTKLSYPRGTIFTSKVTLPSSKFHKLNLAQIVKEKPKDWSKFLKNQSCSTK
jgi:membrane-bound lytic murein transglycosylase D